MHGFPAPAPPRVRRVFHTARGSDPVIPGVTDRFGAPPRSAMLSPRNGRLRNGDPAIPNRHGVSAPRVMPMRRPAATATGSLPASTRNGGSSRGRPSSAPVTPSAWHNRPGPPHNTRGSDAPPDAPPDAPSGTPRRSRILSKPCRGRKARISTALPGSHTAFRHQCSP